jgi:Pvc16 N-terminal domain
MADFGVISDVSTSLVTLLNQQLGQPPLNASAQLSDLSGTAPAGLTLTVTLYEILEDGPSRNRPRQQEPPVGTATVSKKPPMALRLHYLLTPWGGDPTTEQQILGRAMQVLYDDAILAGAQLLKGLQGSSDTLKLTLIPLTLEDRSRVWYAIQKPYRLSVNYEVRVVNLDATAEQRDEVVQSRELDFELMVSQP